MSVRRSRYDSLNGVFLSADVGDFASASVLSQLLGDKFHFSSFLDGIVTFVFHNR